MTDQAEPTEIETKKSKLPVILVVVVTLLLSGGGFFATYSGILSFDSKGASHDAPEDIPAIEFVEIDPIIISLGARANARHLKFSAHLEVPAQYKKDTEMLKPRIVDVLNSYLRAVEVQQLEDPSALTKLKAQMLRRVQIVTGEGRIRDLLISEFVLN